MLGRRDIKTFERDGVIVLRGAVPRRIAAACRASIRHRLAAQGIDTAEPSTWTGPLVHLPWPATPSFDAAARVPALTEAYDQLLGPGTWSHAPTIGGTVPVRFPARRPMKVALWHVDGSYVHEGQLMTSLASPTRGALCLILLSDVGPDDAPTELKLGSHLDVAPVLAAYGDRGCTFIEATSALGPSTLERPTLAATGRAGDVYLCHPFLVHRTNPRHRGDHPRMIAQPGLLLHPPFRLEGGRPRAVERSIRAAVAAAPGPAPAPTTPASRAGSRSPSPRSRAAAAPSSTPKPTAKKAQKANATKAKANATKANATKANATKANATKANATKATARATRPPATTATAKPATGTKPTPSAVTATSARAATAAKAKTPTPSAATATRATATRTTTATKAKTPKPTPTAATATRAATAGATRTATPTPRSRTATATTPTRRARAATPATRPRRSPAR